MTQAEQAMLRYNYLMDATAQTHGDFARTSGTWANQVRLLSLNFDTLKASIGQGLISAFLPVIQAINLLLAKLQQAAEYFRKFMEFLTGVKVTGGQSGVIDDTSMSLDSIGSAGEAASGGLGDAAESADDLKKKLSVLPFDELNQLSSDLSDASSGGSGGGISGGSLGNVDASIDFGDSDLEKAGETFYSRLADALKHQRWWEAGEIIGEGLNDGLQKIDKFIKWDKIGDKISKGIIGITTLFNSIVYNFDWKLLGKTVGDGVNSLIYSLNMLIEGISWKQLGQSFADGLNSIFNTVDWNELGSFLGNKFMILWDILYGTLTKFDYDAAGKDFADGINGIFTEVNFREISKTLYSGINGIFKFLDKFIENIDWDGLSRDFYTGINDFINGIDWGKAGETLSNLFKNLIESLWYVVQNIDWEGLGRSIGEFIINIDWIGIFNDILGLLSDLLLGMIQALWGFIKKSVEGITNWVMDNVPVIENGVSSMADTLVDKFHLADTKTAESLENMDNNTNNTFVNMVKNSQEQSENLKETTENMFSKMKENISNSLNETSKKASEAYSEIKNATSNVATNIKNTLTGKLTSAKNTISNILEGVSNAFTTTMDAAKSVVSKGIEKIKGFFDFDWELPKIKLPHFKIEGKFSLNPPQIPKFSIDWYKAGGLFTGATIVGIGEAGKEAVLPLENKRTMNMIAESILGNASAGMSPEEIRNAVNEGVSLAMMNNAQNQPPINVYATLYTENNEVLARAVTQGQRSIDYRKNPTPRFEY